MKRILDTVPVLVCLVICISLHAGCSRQDSPESIWLDSDSLSFEELVQRAERFLNEGQRDSAYSLSGTVVERKMADYSGPDSALSVAMGQLGRYHSRRNEEETSALFYILALQMNQHMYGLRSSRNCELMYGLAGTIRSLGTKRVPEAESFHLEALEISKEAFGDSSVEVVTSMIELGQHYFAVHELENARVVMESALAIAESLPECPRRKLVTIRRTLGFLHKHCSRYRQAESHLLEALSIAETGPEPLPEPAIDCLEGLCYIYGAQARYDEAEKCFKKALQIFEEYSIPENNNLSSIYKDYGNMLMDLGRLEEAEYAYWTSYDIRLRYPEPDSVGLAESLNNIGLLYTRMGRYAEAEEHLQRALRLRDDHYGPDHPFLVYPLTGLGELFTVLGDYEEADAFYHRALAICGIHYDSDHLHTAWCLRGLAESRRFRGLYAEAEEYYNRALVVEENAMGAENTAVAEILHFQALLHGSTGEYAKALEAYERMLGSRQDFIANQFRGSSEDQKLRFLRIHPLIVNSLFSSALANPSVEAERMALEMVLKGKAVVLEAVAAEKEIAWCSDLPEIREMAGEWLDICGQISDLSITRAMVGDVGTIVWEIDSLGTLKDSLQKQMSVLCSEAALELEARRFDISDVAMSIADSAVLCEIVKYEPYDFSATGSDKERTGEPRYLALTLDHSADISLSDLGKASVIDSLVRLARRIIYDAGSGLDVRSDKITGLETTLRDVTQRLYDMVFVPIEAALGNRKDLFICPDGELNLLPFEILPRPGGRFLIEDYCISYLSTGRDLLRFEEEPERSDWGLLIAAPDFDCSSAQSDSPDFASVRFDQMTPRGVSDCWSEEFYPLPSGLAEAESIKKLLETKVGMNVSLYSGPEAREEVIKTMGDPPYLIHLATHGFFCEDVDVTATRMVENPLLRSGIALANANGVFRDEGTENSQSEDGILTAFEVSGLNLVGTELAVLSACETGVGDIRTGEGVFGLRRAFQHAGARAVVMSLWKVPDIETGQLMNEFYKCWLGGASKKEALRQSALKIIEVNRTNQGHTHPLFWGAFVLVGHSD